MIELLNKQLESTIIKEVRKATQHLQPSDFEDAAVGPDGVPPDSSFGLAGVGISKLLAFKVDKKDLNEKLKEKSNKTDIEMAMRQIQILHKQLKQVSLLLTQKFRASLEGQIGMSQNAKMNKKVNLLHQSLLISNWITNLDTQSVNDSFDNGQNQLPPQLQNFEFQINEDLSRISKMALSPNNSSLNEFVKNQSARINLHHREEYSPIAINKITSRPPKSKLMQSIQVTHKMPRLNSGTALGFKSKKLKIDHSIDLTMDEGNNRVRFFTNEDESAYVPSQTMEGWEKGEKTSMLKSKPLYIQINET